MPYQYNNFCHETLESAVKDEIDNGVIAGSSAIYSPVSYSLGADSAVINYVSDSNQAMTLTRAYPVCTDVGYPSITGLTMAEGIMLNSSVVVLWCIAFGIRSARKVAA